MRLAFTLPEATALATDEFETTGVRQQITYEPVLPGGRPWWIVRPSQPQRIRVSMDPETRCDHADVARMIQQSIERAQTRFRRVRNVVGEVFTA